MKFHDLFDNDPINLKFTECLTLEAQPSRTKVELIMYQTSVVRATELNSEFFPRKEKEKERRSLSTVLLCGTENIALKGQSHHHGSFQASVLRIKALCSHCAFRYIVTKFILVRGSIKQIGQTYSPLSPVYFWRLVNVYYISLGQIGPDLAYDVF